jgi:hypothetical protein
MCTLATIYLICTNAACSAITDHRPALTLCSRGRRRTWRRSLVPRASNYLRYQFLLSSGLDKNPTPPEQIEAKPPKSCCTSRNVAVSSHFGFRFSLCDACMAKLVAGADREFKRLKRDMAWGKLPAKGRTSLVVNFVDTYEKMLAAGAEPRDMSPLMEDLEAQMWEDVRSWFRHKQGVSSADGNAGSMGRRIASANSAGNSFRGHHDGRLEVDQRRALARSPINGGSSTIWSNSTTRCSDNPTPGRVASPESALVHEMFWQGSNAATGRV